MKNILEFIPLLLFFIFYKKVGIISATLILVVATAISVAILMVKTGKIAKMPLFSAIILGIFGFFTWYFQDPIFIKMKPTILNSLFAVIFIGGYYLKKPLLKYVFDGALEMPDNAWLTLGLRFGLFFIFLAIINEFIWRNFSEEFWVSFKVFGFLPMSIIFTISQLPFMLRYQPKDKLKK